jgi:hypothetical protein
VLSSLPWFVWAVLGLIIVIPVTIGIAVMAGNERRVGRAGLKHVRQMSLPDFIQYLTTLYDGLGYHVERPGKGSGDYGVDLILTDGTGRRTAVSARHFQARVGRDEIRALHEGAEYHRCKDALVVTTVGFASAAVAMAEETGAILWDTGDLADAMDKVRARPSFGSGRGGLVPTDAAPAAQGTALPSRLGAGRPAAQAPQPRSPQPALPPQAPTPIAAEPGEANGPPCPVCGTPMMAREAAGRGIWLCSRFPRCNGAQMRGEAPK